MNILVNYKVKNGKVLIDEFTVNGKNVLIFESIHDISRIAIVSTDLDNNDDLRLIKFPEFPFPTIVTKEMAETILRQSNPNNEIENKEPINENKNIGETSIEFGDIQE